MGLTLGTKVHNSHVVEQRSAPLGRLRVVGLEENGHGGTRSGDGFLSVHPAIFGYFVPREPLYTGCLRTLSTAEVNPQSEFHRGSTSDVFAPGRDSVAMARGDGNGAVDACRGGGEIKGQFLGTLPTMNISGVCVPVDTIDKRLSSSLLVLYAIRHKRAGEARYDSYSTDHNRRNDGFRRVPAIVRCRRGRIPPNGPKPL
jgi:hypothetical protein